ncbi:MAG TPA: hypothetical protein VG873_18345 [Burkholderiales bacterium]|nr:hypothetical protein [Burkholderiales bacterium]
MTWLPISRDELQRLQLLEAFAGDECEICGCTDDCACPGGCSWVAPGLCSSCALQASGPEELGP